MARQASPNGVGNRLRSLKQFTAWLLGEQIIAKVPAVGAPIPRRDLD